MTNAFLIALLAAVGVGGVGFVLLGGEDRVDQRRQALVKSDPKARAANLDRASKKKQISESLKELEGKSKRKRADMQQKIEQAGLSMKRNQFLMIFAVLGVVGAAGLLVKTGSPLVAGLVGIMIALGLPNFVLSRLRSRRIKKFVDAFPSALDIIVRGVRAGLPLGDTLRIIASEAQEPVRSEFRRVVESQSIGLSVPEAVTKLALRVPTVETSFFAIVLEIQGKAGGNLSEAIGNLSKTLRERKKMKGKIAAMSMEALASAAIVGAVPFLVSGALYAISPDYMILLFTTYHGRMILIAGLGWMSIGVMMMKKMISFDF